ncbi:Avidin family protein [Enhydrobacter aerosaccus]|uniref:Avidin family protein n=1 Tax=Enhydrobacter aerosaccus TaxID=225324 RepID=A0A1T4QJ78_9HYPH|nr:avidin/streptavidin family protein [Enhydrobacter aerosaccus]SKA03833.1 Avidin family protein [Enhydrobacter aerosaccus]
MRWFTPCALALLVLPMAAAAQSLAPQTRWVNNHGSELVIESIGPDGRLTGTYSSSAPGYKCRGIAFPIVGWVDGERIAYTMQARNGSADCGTMTSWTGYLQGGRLYAEWSLAYFDTEANRPMLDRGTDIYRPK